MVWLLVGLVLQEGQLVGRLGGGSGLAGFFGDVSGNFSGFRRKFRE